MVSNKRALIVSGASALTVTIIHYIAHKMGASVPVVGGIVFASIFLIGYLGMRYGR